MSVETVELSEVDIFAITGSSDLAMRLEQAGGGRTTIVEVEPFPVDAPSFFTRVGDAATPQVVVLDPGVDPTPAFTLLSRLKTARLGFAVVLVSGSARDIALDALRAGFCDVLERNAPADELVRVLERARDTAATEAAAHQAMGVTPSATTSVASPTGRVIAIVSPKGGVGKTTISTNLAVGLALGGQGSCVLVDLDTQFGDVGSGLDLNPQFHLAHVVSKPALRDPIVLKGFLARHQTGLSVVCGVDNPAEADQITSEQISALLRILAAEFDFVVVDTAPGLTEHTLSAMDMATDLVMVTGKDVPGVRGLRKELDTLATIGMVHAKTHIVLNFADEKNGIEMADVTSLIEREVDVAVPRSIEAARAVNAGVPLMQDQVKDPATASFRSLTGRFITLAEDDAKRTRGTNGTAPARRGLGGLLGGSKAKVAS